MMIMPSSSAATVLVDKATSDLLIAPDWTLNIEICDSVNSNHWQAKDVVKAVKKRLQHKSSTVQLLALTLLETLVKNCGDYVHFQIVDRNILPEMVKIVRKKADATVRNKILVLLDSWQEAFGGPGGKYPQYYWSYEELRQSGVQFPERSPDAAPIFTPPAMHPPVRHTQPSYGMPSNASTRLDQAMASEMETLSLSGIDAMGGVAELLTDMLLAATPGDREAVKDELIVDLVDQCRSNQKKLMQMLTSTGDEELLGKGLELNDSLQSVLAKHDAIASGLPVPVHQIADESSHSADASALGVRESEKEPDSSSIVPIALDSINQVEDVDDEEDDFAQLARRHSKHQSSPTGMHWSSNPITESLSAEAVSSSSSNALVLADPPPPVKITTKDQDMIDLLSLALTTTSPCSPAPPVQSTHETPVPPASELHPNGSQAYPGQVSYNNYVAPWAQPQPLPQSNTHLQQYQGQETFQQQHGLTLPIQQQPFQPHQANNLHHQQYTEFEQTQKQAPHPQNVPSRATQSRPTSQYQMFSSSQYPQNSPGYIPPPWAATPGYYNNQRPISSSYTPQNYGPVSIMPTQPDRLRQHNSGSNVQGDPRLSSGPTPGAPVAAQKPFIPSYRLFEDLDVFGNTDGKIKGSSSNGFPSLSGGPGKGTAGNK